MRTPHFPTVLLPILAALLLPACDDDTHPSDPSTDAAPTPDGPPDAAPSWVSDRVEFSCPDDTWTPGACTAGQDEAFTPAERARHIPDDEPLTYDQHPPHSGDHRGGWGRWGAYDFLPPQRWLHNLEHGGVAFLHHPCADPALVDALREVARAFPDDDGGPFRWVLTPYVGLPSAVAVVAWGNVYSAECVDADAIGAFVGAHYRRAPEDVAADGSYDEGWQGR